MMASNEVLRARALRRAGKRVAGVLVALAGSTGSAACTKVHEPPPAAVVETPVAAPSQVQAPAPARPAWENLPRTATGPVGAPVGAARDAAPDVRKFDRNAIQKVIDGAMGTFAGCLQSGPPGAATVNVEFEASPYGKASGLKISGAAEPTERCIRSAVFALNFPPFDGAPERISFPLSVYRPTAVPPAGAADPGALAASASPSPSPTASPNPTPPGMPLPTTPPNGPPQPAQAPPPPTFVSPNQPSAPSGGSAPGGAAPPIFVKP